MTRNLVVIFALVVGAAALLGCQTDRQRYNIGEWERPIEPEGLFPSNVDKANWSAKQVTANFRDNPEKMMNDPSLTMRTLVYFEWLANDLKANYDVDAFQVRKLLDARNELRGMLKIPADASSNETMFELYAMSKFLAIVASGQGDSEEAPELAERRQFLVKAKGQVSKLLDQTLAAQAAAGTAPQTGG